MSKQTQQLGGGLWGNGLTGMEFARPAAGPVDVPAESPEPPALPHWTQFPEEEVWGCMYWFGKRDPIIRSWRMFAAHFPVPPVEGLCYDLDGRPVRCIKTTEGHAVFEEVGGNVGGGMDRITEVAY